MKKRIVLFVLALMLAVGTLAGLSVSADTLDFADVHVGDIIDNTVVTSITNCQDFAVCASCGEIYFCYNASTKSVNMETEEAHAAHVSDTGWLPGSSWAWFVENMPGKYKVVLNEFEHLHTELTEVKEVAATCTKTGVKAHWSCSCGKCFEDAEAKVEIEDLTIPMAAHELKFTYSDDESAITVTCENCDLSSTLTVKGETAAYTGNPVTGSFTADEDFAEIVGTDLTLAYLDADNNLLDGAPTEAGKYQVGVVVFTKTGTAYAPYAEIEITPLPFGVTFGGETEFTFDGETHTPTYEVKDTAGNVLVEGRDYSVEKIWKDANGEDAQSKAGWCAGEGKLLVKGIGNFDGEFSVDYSVAKAKMTVKGLKETYDYTGKDVIAAGDYEAAGIDGEALAEGTDYTVSVDEAREPGKHTVKFTAVNPNYESAEFTFTIGEKPAPETGDALGTVLVLISVIGTACVCGIRKFRA